MSNDKFSVSVKGILFKDGNYLLRKNKRNEYELLGGRLEPTDESFENRLTQEFIEESGIRISVDNYREPWLFKIGQKNIIIVPYVCSASFIPDILFDEDGGEIHWIDMNQLFLIKMPRGYVDSINNVVPRKSYSPSEDKFLEIIPNYTDHYYNIIIKAVTVDGVVRLEETLTHFNEPRQLLREKLGNEYYENNILPLPTEYTDGKVYINYILL
jgi:hypothetical protein